MPLRSFAEELEDAAERIETMSKADLQMILQSTAERLRKLQGVELDMDTERALDRVAEESDTTRSELIREIVTDWLAKSGYGRSD